MRNAIPPKRWGWAVTDGQLKTSCSIITAMSFILLSTCAASEHQYQTKRWGAARPIGRQGSGREALLPSSVACDALALIPRSHWPFADCLIHVRESPFSDPTALICYLWP